MLVRMRASISGMRNGQPWPKRGEDIDLPDHEAKDLCSQRLAEPVAKAEPVETATPPKAEVSKGPEPEKAVESAAEERDKPKRGRPAGSKNRAKSEDVSDGD